MKKSTMLSRKGADRYIGVTPKTKAARLVSFVNPPKSGLITNTRTITELLELADLNGCDVEIKFVKAKP